MKKIKNSLLAVLTIAIVIPAIQGCKKGENDPFISFKSRDARITAVWKLSKVEIEKISTTPGNPTTTDVEAFDGERWTTNGANGIVYSLEVTISKDGTSTYTEVKAGFTETKTNIWYWADSKKNKTNIFITLPSQLQPGGIWEVNQLKSKELILKSTSYVKNIDDIGDITQTDNKYIYTFAKTANKGEKSE